MGTVSGKATLSFSSLLSFSIRGQLLKKRICSSGSKFFPLRADPILEGLCPLGSKTEVSKVVSLCKFVGKIDSIPLNLTYTYSTSVEEGLNEV